MQKGDHENNGQMYLHVCQHCYAQGKSYPHSGKDCKNKSKNDWGTAEMQCPPRKKIAKNSQSELFVTPS